MDMQIIYRYGTINDLQGLKKLAVETWKTFESQLTPDNWLQLYQSLQDDETYAALLSNSKCIVATTPEDDIAGMVFLVPRGNPTEIYLSEWCYIRFLTVNPLYGGNGIGRQLTEACLQLAVGENETTVALHTSEMMVNAMHIYESMGFKRLRAIDNRLGKKYWLYTLNL